MLAVSRSRLSAGAIVMRRPSLARVLFLALMVLGVAGVLIQPSATGATKLHPGATPWSAHLTTAGRTIVDSRGTQWIPGTGLVGGVVTATRGAIADTASPALYQSARIGVQRWAIRIPAPGTYALDVLLCDTSNVGVGARVFSVSATDGMRWFALASDLDVAAEVGGWHPYHLTATVTIARPMLALVFSAKTGAPLVSALAITSMNAPKHTLLDQRFDGAAGTAPDPSVWSTVTGAGWEGTSTVEAYTFSPANVSLTGTGTLAINAIRQDNSGGDGTASYTSARLITQGRFTFGYAHVEARMKLPPGAGMWPAFWAVGANQSQVDWPSCGEIDVVEGLGRSTTVVAGHIHSLGNAEDPVGYRNQRIASMGRDWNSGVDTTGAFHTYAVDYRPGAITFLFDGRPYFVAANEDMSAGESWPFDGASNYLLLNLAVGNNSWTGSPTGEAPGTTHTLLVDQITVTG